MSPTKRRTTGKAPAESAAPEAASLEAASKLPAAGSTTSGDAKVNIEMFVRELIGIHPGIMAS